VLTASSVEASSTRMTCAGVASASRKDWRHAIASSAWLKLGMTTAQVVVSSSGRLSRLTVTPAAPVRQMSIAAGTP
jgi:hypothetical protein